MVGSAEREMEPSKFPMTRSTIRWTQFVSGLLARLTEPCTRMPRHVDVWRDDQLTWFTLWSPIDWSARLIVQINWVSKRRFKWSNFSNQRRPISIETSSTNRIKLIKIARKIRLERQSIHEPAGKQFHRNEPKRKVPPFRAAWSKQMQNQFAK